MPLFANQTNPNKSTGTGAYLIILTFHAVALAVWRDTSPSLIMGLTTDALTSLKIYPHARMIMIDAAKYATAIINPKANASELSAWYIFLELPDILSPAQDTPESSTPDTYKEQHRDD
jgi:hypothetical protein